MNIKTLAEMLDKEQLDTRQNLEFAQCRVGDASTQLEKAELELRQLREYSEILERMAAAAPFRVCQGCENLRPTKVFHVDSGAPGMMFPGGMIALDFCADCEVNVSHEIIRENCDLQAIASPVATMHIVEEGPHHIVVQEPLPPPRLFKYVLPSGESFEHADVDDDGEAFEAVCEEHGLEARSWKRMGRFEVVTIDMGVDQPRFHALVCQRYDEDVDSRAEIEPTSEFWQSHVKDRVSQMNDVEFVIRNHVMEGEVMAVINAERKRLLEMPFCENCNGGMTAKCPACFEAMQGGPGDAGCPHGEICEECRRGTGA